MPGFHDITGHCCNDLKAVKPVGKDKSGHMLWECVCLKCGNKRIINYVQFMHSKTKDCGCTPCRGNDLTGKTFGNLTAIKIVGRSKGGYHIWLCKCESCGKKVTRTSRQLYRKNYPNRIPKCPICGD